MSTNYKLTNSDISANYREKEYWLMRSDFMGAFAYWVVAQSPYEAPDISKALKAFSNHINKKIQDDIPLKFTYDELNEFISEEVFESIPEIEALNHPQIDSGGTEKKYLFVSRYDSKIEPDYDFIDLGALARNVFFMILRNQIIDE